MRTTLHRASRWRDGLWLLPILGLGAPVGCATGSGLELQSSQRLAAEVRTVLGAERPSPEYHRVRSRLQEGGPEVDGVLVGLIQDTRARTEARADALVLLADRRSPVALPTLERALLYDNERLRSAAVLGLNRLAGTSEMAVELIRRATYDRSRTVRMNALQSLDVRQIETIRAVLERESDPEVRRVGLQLVSLAESRGAALSPDRRGVLRTAAGEDEPQLVFRPFEIDSVADLARGDLRIELPSGRDIPLVASVQVMANVVPAFFSHDRSSVVVEDNGEIRVVNVGTRDGWSLGAGIAPRPIPFTHHFVFLREAEAGRTRTPVGTEIVYDVYRAAFSGGDAEVIGTVRAVARPDRRGGESPVRWMAVSEVEEGFVLRGEGVETLALPPAVFRPAQSQDLDAAQSSADS